MSAVAGKDATAAEIAAAVSTGKATAASVVAAALARVATLDKTCNAFTSVVAERARATAAAVDAAIAAGRPAGPLAGVPFAVKNLIDIQGIPTLAGSKINAEHAPAAQDATLVQRLEAAGAILVGALNMGEYAYDFTGRNAHAGPSRNPRDPAHMTGGSSGGSGAAVAGGLVPLSLGSDTNGSIRVPASLCGIFGLKPTYGRLSRAGSFLFCDSLDHLGPMARSVRDLALAFDVMQGPDPRDPVCTERPPAPTLPGLDAGIAGLRIAVAGDYFERQLEPVAADAVAAVARALGASRKVVVPDAARARGCAYLITAAEAGALHLPRLRTRADDFDPETRERFMAGALTPAAWYIQAQRFRRAYRQLVLETLQDVDVLIAPATPVTAPRIDQTMMTVSGVAMPVRANLGIFTQPISFIGLPVVAAPLQRPGGLPIAVQLIAKPFDEQAALRVAHWLEGEGVCAAPTA
ncbi:AtzE family amidohydrolase [Vineibacter terrae]|uniref:AtzE family amidohydrolase n=1 Tax=Vineibacter terrae TaxID=2586908 RepID=A0A5C8PS08_9HYPH|nr:AtzE family amidohydrolase [Vineibacter terrae]TXL79520.1 AtzE family amidohydrolase [Vineibacter terrae]